MSRISNPIYLAVVVKQITRLCMDTLYEQKDTEAVDRRGCVGGIRGKEEIIS